MSRVTPPVKKGVHTFLRSISSSAKSARPSVTLLSSQDYLPSRAVDLKAECARRGLSASGTKIEVRCHVSFHLCYRCSEMFLRPRYQLKS